MVRSISEVAWTEERLEQAGVGGRAERKRTPVSTQTAKNESYLQSLTQQSPSENRCCRRSFHVQNYTRTRCSRYPV